MHIFRTLVAFVFLAVLNDSRAQSISQAANHFLNSLPADVQKNAQFVLESDERFNMNFVPLVRKGPTFHDFDEEQKRAALELLKVSLSQVGFNKTREIMELEKVLAILEGESKLADGRSRRDPLNYHFCIFGTPASSAVWAWRFEGHHISLNFVVDNEKIASSTPSFFGANPAIVKNGDQKGKQVLKLEMDLGFKLVNSLNQDQLKTARFSEDAPAEIVTGNDRKVDVPLKGINYKSLGPAQQKDLMNLLKVYVENYELGFSATLMKKIEKAGFENLYFAWAGSTKPGSGQYYRIQGPMLLIEYDNVQNDANHVHTVVRDLTNDYAEDILREHYQKHH